MAAPLVEEDTVGLQVEEGTVEDHQIVMGVDLQEVNTVEDQSEVAMEVMKVGMAVDLQVVTILVLLVEAMRRERAVVMKDMVGDLKVAMEVVQEDMVMGDHLVDMKVDPPVDMEVDHLADMGVDHRVDMKVGRLVDMVVDHQAVTVVDHQVDTVEDLQADTAEDHQADMVVDHLVAEREFK